MTMRVVGGGLGRTGTTSLKAALEQLLGQPCHHMFEVAINPEQLPDWTAAARGEAVDWDQMLDGYGSIVDWPGVAFWPELTAHFPEALVVLSVRDPDAWYESARSTIFVSLLEDAKPDDPWDAFLRTLFGNRFTLDVDDKAGVLAAFEAHYAAVRAAVPADRLLEWSVSDGWGPLCAALGVDVPAEPFPRLNTRDDWATRQDPDEA